MSIIQTLFFRPIQLSDKNWIESCRDIRQNPFTALSFPSLYTWREPYGLEIAGNGLSYVVRSRQDQAYFCPCGDPAACAAIVQSLPHPVRLLYLTQDQADKFRNAGAVRERPDLNEYLARTLTLALREGHASNSYKMKCRHFQREHAYEVHRLTPEDIPYIIQLADKIEHLSPESDVGDMPVLRSMLETFEALDFQGLLLRTQTGAEAFIIGYENTPGMFTMTMAKHDPLLPPETTAVMVHELAIHLAEQYPVINLEEDLGMAGLRQAKELYSPIGQLRVFEALLNE
ncbi:MAG: DUF2156 domain-containing protein [Clostridia bacterium]|nr:DUF2156 domain-containing protein [Clostridia bacterium]